MKCEIKCCQERDNGYLQKQKAKIKSTLSLHLDSWRFLIFYFSVLKTLLLSIFILYSYLFLAFSMVAHQSIPFFVFPSIAELLLFLFHTFTYKLITHLLLFFNQPLNLWLLLLIKLHLLSPTLPFDFTFLVITH